MSVGLSYKETPREVVRMKNTSGAGVVAGDLCVLKAVAAGDEVTTTTTGGDNQLLRGGGFMALETIANTASGRFLRLGFTNALKVDGTTDIAIGDRLTTFTTAGIAKIAAVGDPYFAVALEAYALNDSLGVIDAILTHAGAEDPSSASAANLVVWALPGSGFLTGAAINSSTQALPVVRLANNLDQSWDADVSVPSGATSISSIKVFYERDTTGNLRLVFPTAHVNADATSATETDQTDVVTSYASGGLDGQIESLTVPAGAFNGLTAIDVDDLVGIRVDRRGSEAADTYEGAWDVVGVQFIFA